MQVVDPEVSRLAQGWPEAQELKNAMPYGNSKKVPRRYSPPALMVYYFQEISGLRSGGYNSPILTIFAATSAQEFIRLPMPGEDADPTLKAMLATLFTSFCRRPRSTLSWRIGSGAGETSYSCTKSSATGPEPMTPTNTPNRRSGVRSGPA